jgi:ferredoxin
VHTGVVLCSASADLKLAQEIAHLGERLREKGSTPLQCSERLLNEEPEALQEFIAKNELQAVLVITDLSRQSVTEALRYSVEKAGLGRLSVGYLDIKLAGSSDVGLSTVLANLARLDRNDYVKDAVFRTALGPAKISRRQLLRSVPRALKVESDIPIVLQDRCTHRSTSCNYCIQACPVKVISPTKDSVVIDDQTCIECGACARECPLGAIQGPSVSDDQVIAVLNTLSAEDPSPEKRILLLTCPIGLERLVTEAGEDGKFRADIVPVVVPCVGAMGSIHYLWAAALGINLVTACPDASCSRISAVLPISHHLESSKKVLENVGEISVTLQHLTLNRTDSISEKISQSPEAFSAKRNTKLSGSRRSMTLEALRTLQGGSENALLLPADNMLPFFDVTVDDNACTFCAVCEKECPDQAISIVKNEASLNLMFDPSACGGCKVCENVCPEDAITVSRHKQFSEVMAGPKATKIKDENATCEVCGASLGSKQGLLVLEKRLTGAGYSPSMLKSLHICVRCKQQAFRPAK